VKGGREGGREGLASSRGAERETDEGIQIKGGKKRKNRHGERQAGNDETRSNRQRKERNNNRNQTQNKNVPGGK